MRILRYAVAFFCLFLAACDASFQVTDTQDIKVDAYDDPAANLNLAVMLASLDPDYYRANVPALTQVEGKDSVKVEGFRRDKDNQVFFRITYRKDNDSVAQNYDALQQQFAALVPKMIKQQLEAKDLLAETQPIGKAIAIDLFTNAAVKSFQDAAPLLKYFTAEKPFVETVDKARAYFGKLTDISPAGSAFMEPYGHIPADVLIQDFNADTSSGHPVALRISMIKVDDSWKMLGFGYKGGKKVMAQ